jgi:hypothetical protein
MIAYTTLNSAKKTYHYYRCSNREHQSCSNMKHRRAGWLEKKVMDAVAKTLHPHAWESFVDDVCNRRLEDLSRLGRSDPATTRERLAGRIVALETKLSRARELFIDGDLSRPDYEEKKSLIRGEIEMVREELTKVDDLDDEIRGVEDLRRTLMSIENPLSGNYAFIPGDDYDTDSTHNEKNVRRGFGYRSKRLAAKRRQKVYRRMGMQVKVGEELEISMGIREPLVSKLGTASASNAGSTSY